jgi:poly(hydroxyalkanoate) depolymerase family esterase
MNMDFAAAMRRAARVTRAYDPLEATRIIQDALAQQASAASMHTAPPQARASQSKPGASLRLIDPGAEIVEPIERAIQARAQREPAQRRPLGEVLRKLREGKRTLDAFDVISSLRTRSVSPPPIAEGAQFITRVFACDAGTRSYKLYIPASASSRPNGLIVMLHGCKQNPDDFASGTAMNDVAEKHGLMVAYPCQSAGANASSCWNWFNPADQMRDRGEPAIIAGMTRELIAVFAIPQHRTFIAGLSAGGAMAAIMGETYPDLYAGVGIHSGLAFGSAKDVMSAFAAMRGEGGQRIAGSAPSSTRSMRMIIFQGSADRLVHPSNADRIVAQARPKDWVERSEQRQVQANGRLCNRTSIAAAQGGLIVEYWLIEGAGHAWSGGKPSGSYTDVSGPDASTEMVRFFLETK